jgi:hypothetical protein
MQLQQIYLACIDAVLEGISTYSHTHSIQESEKSCIRKLQYIISGKKLNLDKDLLEPKKKVEFSLTAHTYTGKSVVLQDGQYCSLVKTVWLKHLFIDCYILYYYLTASDLSHCL